jgi:hypothetical protein
VAARDLDKVVGKRALVDIPKDQQMKWEYLST